MKIFAHYHIGIDAHKRFSQVHVLADDGSTGWNGRLIMLWAQPLEQDRYRIRIRPERDGWTVGMIPTADGMTIDRGEKHFHLVAVPDSEVPEWYARRLEKALVRMSERAAGHLPPPPSSSP